MLVNIPSLTAISSLFHQLNSPSSTSTRYLLGSISENMTLSTSPTFILSDTSSHSFALKIMLPESLKDESSYMGKFDAKGWKKSWTAVVRNPVRRGVKEGVKMGWLESGVDNVWVS
jgi:hypothetical protein